MAFTFFKSATDDGGVIGDQLTDNELNNLFSILPAQERLAGIERFRKIWVKSDAAVATVYLSEDQAGAFYYTCFAPTNPDDTMGDITGSERRYGALYISDIVDVSGDTLMTLDKMTPTNKGSEIFAANDIVRIGADNYTIASIESDNTTTIVLRFSVTIDAQYIGTNAFSLYDTGGFAADATVPLWISEYVWANAPAVGNEITPSLIWVV